MHKTSYIAAAVVLLGLTFHLPVHAAKTIYRCEKGGQITLTDKPCDESKPADASSGTTIPSSNSPSTVGIWNGQLQYSGTEAGETIPAAHTVVPLTLEFTLDGKVTGASPDNGCNWLGVWSQGGKGIERMISLDVALTSCKYAGLDRRYTGTFLLAVPDSSGQVSLLAYTPPIPGQKIRGYTLGGTLRRR
jgi:hypothetical protein